MRLFSKERIVLKGKKSTPAGVTEQEAKAKEADAKVQADADVEARKTISVPGKTLTPSDKLREHQQESDRNSENSAHVP